MNNILNLALISFSLIILCFISTNVIYNTIYAQIFEFNEEDYYSSSSDNEQTNSQEKSTNSEEDTGKENCITNQEASVLQASTDSNAYLNNF
jgi:hypothetical protein